jgi:hypothetical protein
MYEPASSMRAMKATEGYNIYRRPASFDGKSLLARNRQTTKNSTRIFNEVHTALCEWSVLLSGWPCIRDRN